MESIKKFRKIFSVNPKVGEFVAVNELEKEERS